MTHYAFVDGAHLRATLRSTREYFDIPPNKVFNYQQFFWQIFGSANRVFYYDAFPSQKNGQSNNDYEHELRETTDLFDQLNSLGAVHVKTGVSTSQRSSRKNRVQKGVDILLALDVYRTAVGGAEIVNLFASDGDFHPVLQALHSTQSRSRLFCNRSSSPRYLTELADYVHYINEIDLVAHFFEDPAERSLFAVGTGSVPDRTVYGTEQYPEKFRFSAAGETFNVYQTEDLWLMAFGEKRPLQFLQARSEQVLRKFLHRELGVEMTDVVVIGQG